MQLARTRDTHRAKQSCTDNFRRTCRTQLIILIEYRTQLTSIASPTGRVDRGCQKRSFRPVGKPTPSVHPYRPFAALARRTSLLLFLFFLCRLVASPLSPPPLSPAARHCRRYRHYRRCRPSTIFRGFFPLSSPALPRHARLDEPLRSDAPRALAARPHRPLTCDARCSGLPARRAKPTLRAGRVGHHRS